VTEVASPSSLYDDGHRVPYDGEYLLRNTPQRQLPGVARGRHATARGQGFEQVVAWTVLGGLVPGSGLIAAGKRGAGVFVVAVTVLLGVAAAGAYLVIDPTVFAASLVGSPDKILLAAGALAALIVGWALVVLATHASARRFAALTRGQRLLSALLVASLIAIVAVPAGYAAQDALLARDTITMVFKDRGSPLNKNSKGPDTTKADPWAGVPRVNVLLMGGDSGLDRVGIRPDTMIVASIDTRTGNTVLFSIPRNLQHVPFPPGSRGRALYPDGFYCHNSAGANTECLLNALWTWGDDHPSYYPGDKHPGLTATVQAIELLTGLSIDQYVMLNLRGFEDFVDAIGGVTINAQARVPVGGHGNKGEAGYSRPSSWISPGVQHMDGYHALWYGRSRQYSSDFDRMGRQRCVFGAVVKQANPASLALGFADIMKTLQKNFLTSIPLKDVDAWVALALRVKKAKIASLPFTDTVINTVHPDVDTMRALVKAAIDPAPQPGTATTTPTPSPSRTKKTTTGSTPTTAATQATDLNTVC
jgi:LCP family protein required for cell wall assembly